MRVDDSKPRHVKRIGRYEHREGGADRNVRIECSKQRRDPRGRAGHDYVESIPGLAGDPTQAVGSITAAAKRRRESANRLVTDHAKHGRETGDGPVDTGDQRNPHSDQHTDATRPLWENRAEGSRTSESLRPR
jgi:hypothetical protein